MEMNELIYWFWRVLIKPVEHLEINLYIACKTLILGALFC